MTAPAPAAARASRAWLLPMVLVILAAELLVELAYARYPLPPGVDPADWIQRSFAWVGLPAVTPDAVGSPYLYPPVMFPLLGAVVRLGGGPLAAGFIFGGLLLLGFGVTTIHLARRFLVDGPTQLLFVGLAVLNGTTLQMLFWGGYPNFLALIFVNESLVFLLAFVTTRSMRSGLLFYGSLALIYLTHDLTFIILVGGIGFAAVLFTLRDRGFLLQMVRHRATWIGVPGLVATIGAYGLALRLAHIEAPSYFGANPAAYQLDNIGRFFGPLAGAPTFTPSGGVVTLSPGLVVGLLVGSAGLIFLLAAYLERATAGRHPTWTLTAGLAVSALLVPAVGWVAHVDTDYTRFVYFLPLPAALGIALAAETVFRRATATPAEPGTAGTSVVVADVPSVRRWITSGGPVAAGVVAVVLILLFATVTAPMASSNELTDAGPSHDAAFLSALKYLAAAGSPGSVLTLQSSVRWVEAISSRGAFDVGPTWLLFEPWQITNAEETYWAFNSQFAITNNHDVLAFSGGYRGVDASPTIAAPLYAAYLQGVAVPMIDVDTADLVLNVTTANGTFSEPAGSGGAPTLVAPTSGGSATLAFQGADFELVETSSTPSAGGASITFSVVPEPGVVVNALDVHLRMPSNLVTLLHTPASAGVRATGGGALQWSTATLLGPELDASTITTTVVPTPAPATLAVAPTGGANAATYNFSGAGSAPFAVRLALNTSGASNPAIQLPALLNTSAFLAEHQIRFLLLPTKSGYQYTSGYFQTQFGFRSVDPNPEWTVFAR